MAIGAQLKVTTEDGNSQYDIVSTSAGFGASRDPRAHFGLGQSTRAERLEIRWPSGGTELVENLPANHVITVREGKGVVSRVPFRR